MIHLINGLLKYFFYRMTFSFTKVIFKHNICTFLKYNIWALLRNGHHGYA